ncbi:acyl-CoA-binding domain 3 [Hibiscus trionum]|uniref:Acyl-CoA-binding domain 3 n=1 Tax=Hibiscus trionum TaxID=183268 RepID=A0A9W7HHA7_HIBTR|nr:acyl-CoA-binding domain 3 [Hibiscus trionum]
MELFLTALFALVFSFLIAKIVSLATAGGGSASGVDGKPVTDADDAVIMRELDKLKVQGIESEKKVDLVKESGDTKVDVFESGQSGVGDQGFESEKQVECVEESSAKVVDQLEAEEGEGSKVEGFEGEKEVQFIQETAKKIVDLEPEQAGVVELKLDDILAEKKIEEIGEEIEAENETKAQPEKCQMKGLGDKEKDVKVENDDDDWERVEKSELDKLFRAAAEFIEHKGDLGMGNDVQMQLYGLHKIATEGPCRDPQPLVFMASSRSKWNAWQRLGNMNPEAAMEQYVTLLSDKVPGWMEDNSDGDRNFGSANGGVPSSIAPDLNSFPDKQTIFMHERNADLKSTSGDVHITESTSFEKQVLFSFRLFLV